MTAAWIIASVLVLAIALIVVVLVSRRLIVSRLEGAAASERVLSFTATGTGDELEALIAAELGDPTLRVLYRTADRAELLDAVGEPFDDVAAGIRRRFGLLDDAFGPTVFVDTTGENAPPASTRDAVFAAATLALEHTRLQALLRRQLADVRESRTRLVRAALDERLDLESRLHDGAQSRLFAAMAEISRARAHTTDDALLAIFAESNHNLVLAVEELRALVKGRILPSALREAGLCAAIEVATEQFPIAVEVVERAMVDRPGEATEIAGYLGAIDLLHQSATQAGATFATVAVDCVDDELCVSVTHDGLSLAPYAAVEDRVQGLNGRVTMTESQHTTITLRIPCGY